MTSLAADSLHHSRNHRGECLQQRNGNQFQFNSVPGMRVKENAVDASALISNGQINVI